MCVHLTSKAAAITLAPKTESMAGFIRLSITHTHPYSETKNTILSLSLSLSDKAAGANNARKEDGFPYRVI